MSNKTKKQLLLNLPYFIAGLDGENGQEDLNELTKKEWTSIRGKRISMIFQEPMTALNPLIKVGKQVRECLLCILRCLPHTFRNRKYSN